MKRALLASALMPFLASCLPSSVVPDASSTGAGGQTTGVGGNQGGSGGGGGSDTGGSGGVSTGGSGGGGGRGGSDGGGAGGGGGVGTGGTGGVTAGNPVCDSIKSFLDGFEYVLPCGPNQSYSVLVCANPAGACAGGAEYLVQGTRNTDTKFTVAGTASQSCTLTLTVQGVVEPKHYSVSTTANPNRCTTYFGSQQEGFAQGPAPGGVTSGCYPTTSGNYNVYMMHVSDSPTALTGTGVTGMRYFWNAINQNEAHFSYPINYTTPPITIKGGQTIWMLADDSNCSAIKNCATTSVDNAASPPGRCDGITLPNLVFPAGKTINQPYNGQFILLHVATAQ